MVEKYLVSTEENRFEYSPVPKRCQEIRQITIKNNGCNKKMAEEVSGVDDKAFRTRLPVPRNQVNKSRACKSAIFHCILDRKT